MKLDKLQKEDLKSLKNHPGFKVLLLIEEEATKELFGRLATFNVDDEKDREEIKKRQNYQRARTHFFENIENHLREVFKNYIPGIDD